MVNLGKMVHWMLFFITGMLNGLFLTNASESNWVTSQTLCRPIRINGKLIQTTLRPMKHGLHHHYMCSTFGSGSVGAGITCRNDKRPTSSQSALSDEPATSNSRMVNAKLIGISSDGIYVADVLQDNLEFAHVIPSGSVKPGGICFDSVRKKIYWIESSKIYRANLDGSGMEIFLDCKSDNVAAIALAGKSEVLFRAYGRPLQQITLQSIGAGEGNTSSEVVLYNIEYIDPPPAFTASLVVDEEYSYLYWSTSSAVYRKSFGEGDTGFQELFSQYPQYAIQSFDLTIDIRGTVQRIFIANYLSEIYFYKDLVHNGTQESTSLIFKHSKTEIRDMHYYDGALYLLQSGPHLKSGLRICRNIEARNNITCDFRIISGSVILNQFLIVNITEY